MKITNKFTLFLISFIFIALSLIAPMLKSNANTNEQKQLDIIFTHDTHSHVLPVKETDNNGNITEYGGYARLATAMKTIREQSKNSITVDAGDFTSGSLFQTIFANHAAELRLLGNMGVDVSTQGNHEFDFNISGFSQMLNSAKNSNDKLPQFVMSNIDLSPDENGNYSEEQTQLQEAMNNYGVKDYTIIQKSNVKIAVFALLGEDANKNIVSEGISFKDNIQTSKEIVTKIKENEDPDMIICLSHSGTSEKVDKSEDEILAKEVPDIDVIVSGHTHTTLQTPIIYGDTYVVSCGAYCKQLGNISLSENEKGKWTLNKYELIAIDGSLAEDKQIQAKTNEFKEIIQKEYLNEYGYKFDDVIGYSPYSFVNIEDFGKTVCEEPLGNLISDSYRYALSSIGDDVDIAIVPHGTTRASFVKGNITVADTFNVNSLGVGLDGKQCYPLVKAYVKGKDLKSICEIDASVSALMNTAKLYISGLAYSYNPNRMFMDKVTDVKIINSMGQKEEVDDDKLYSVVAGWYSVQMLSSVKSASYGLLDIPILDEKGKQITDSKFTQQIVYKNGKEYKEWQALTDYIRSFEKVNDISQLPQYYSQTHELKSEINSNNILRLIENPGKMTIILLIAVFISIAIFIALIFLLFILVRKIISLLNMSINKNRKCKGM